jgi:hypothetical protein
MTARPVLTPSTDSTPVDVTGKVQITQDLGDGPLVVAQDDSLPWRVLNQIRTPKGQTADQAATALGEAKVAFGDTVILQTDFTLVANVAAYPISVPATDGWATATAYCTTTMASGIGIQVSLDNGLNWQEVYGRLEGTGVAIGNSNTTRSYATSPFNVSLPPCSHIRVVATHTTAGRYKFYLALSKAPRVNNMAVVLSDAQLTDTANVGTTSNAHAVVVSGLDSSKVMRPFAQDSTFTARRQSSTNSATGSTNIPYYGNPVATAMARREPQLYNVDQPAALQADNYGNLRVNLTELRQLQERALLLQEAAYMQQLDPNRGFEFR